MPCPTGYCPCNGGCINCSSPCPGDAQPTPDFFDYFSIIRPDVDGNYDISNDSYVDGELYSFEDNGGIFALRWSQRDNCDEGGIFLQKTVPMVGGTCDIDFPGGGYTDSEDCCDSNINQCNVFYLKVGDFRTQDNNAGPFLLVTNNTEVMGDEFYGMDSDDNLYHFAIPPFTGTEVIPDTNPFADGQWDDPQTSSTETQDYQTETPYNYGAGNSSGGTFDHADSEDFWGQPFFTNTESDNSYYRFMIMSSGTGCSRYEITGHFLIYLPIEGCIDPTADNFAPLANIENGDCYFERQGCTDSNACNYGGDYLNGWDGAVYNPVGVNTCGAGDPGEIQEDGSLICLSCSYNLQFTEEPVYSAETFGDFETDLTLEIISYELSTYDGTNYSTDFNPYIINTFAWYWTVVDDGGLSITLENYDDDSDPTTGTPNEYVIFNTPNVSEDTEIILGLRAVYSTYPIVTYDLDDPANGDDCGITQYWPDDDATVYSEIPLTITNNVVFGCTDPHADTSTYNSAATNENGTCEYNVGDGVGVNGIICKDPNAINYFCNEHPYSYPCTGESFDSDEDGSINGTYNLGYLTPSDLCHCQFNPVPSFRVLNVNAVEITEITERDTIILEDTSVAANPTPGSYTAAYIASCGVTMETPTWTITNTDNSGEIILNESQPSYQVPFFTDPSSLYSGGGELSITVDVTNVVPDPASTNSSTSALTTIDVIDLDVPIITYPDIYLQGDNGLNIVGITLLTESITDYEFVDLLNNSYYELDGVTPQSFNDGDKIRFDFGTQTFPTAATYTESVTEGICDTQGNPVCNPTTEQFGFTDVCGDGTCVPNLGWSFTSLSYTTLNPGQGLQIRVQNAGYLRWGV